jgi:hypothetical protein
MTKNSTYNPLDRVSTLTFDIFGTVLDLAGSSPEDRLAFVREIAAGIRVRCGDDFILGLKMAGIGWRPRVRARVSRVGLVPSRFCSGQRHVA